jgi:flavin-binding protein dodecin
MTEQQLTTPPKKGRPTKYTKTLVRDIIDKLSRGVSIRDAVKECGITWVCWRNWILKDDKLKDAYVRAKELGIEYIIGDLDKRIENALDRQKISMSEVKLLEVYSKNMQWKAGKLAPKYYGTEKQTLSITDNDEKKIEISWQS